MEYEIWLKQTFIQFEVLKVDVFLILYCFCQSLEIEKTVASVCFFVLNSQTSFLASENSFGFQSV